MELLQSFQEGLGSVVFPLLVAVGGLLSLITVVYLAAVLVHWRSVRTRRDLGRSWRRSFTEGDTTSNFEDLPRMQVPPYDPRDDFVEALRGGNLSPEETEKIYRKVGFYDRDREDLSSRSWWKKVQALHRLKHVSLAGLEGTLTSLVYDPNHEVRLLALDSISHLGRLPELDPVELFDSFGEELQSYLEIKLLTLEPEVSFLNPLVESGKGRLRRAGATLLGQPGKVRSLAALEELVGDDELRVRKRAAGSLGRIGTPECFPLLGRASGDPAPAVREAAAESLGRVSHEDSVETLDRLAGDEDFRVRLAAFNSLTRFGEEGREAISNHWSESRRLAREAIFESYQS